MANFYWMRSPVIVCLLFALTIYLLIFPLFEARDCPVPARASAPPMRVGDASAGAAGSSVGGAAPPGRAVLDYSQCMAHVASLASEAVDVQPPWKELNTQPETMRMIEEAGGLTDNMRAFMSVYEVGVWGSGSGVGSSLPFAARTICVLSQNLLTLLNVTLLIDLPCGDQQWAPTLRALTPGLKYIGIDAMPGLVQYNRERFGHGGPGEPEFWLADMAVEGGPFEFIRKRSKLWKSDDRVAVLTRHVLEHNTVETTSRYLNQLKSSGALYLIGTTALANIVPVNEVERLTAGGYVRLNMHAPPFNFPHGILEWFETAQLSDGTTCMEIWETASIPTF